MTIIGIYLFSFLIIFELLNKIFYSLNNSSALNAVPLNLTSISLALVTIILISLLLFKNNFARLIILLLSYTIVLSSLIIFIISLKDIQYLNLYDYLPLIIKILLNLLVIFMLSNQSALELYKVKNYKKEQQFLIIISAVIATGFVYVFQ